MLRRALPSVLVAALCGGLLWTATDGGRAFTSEAARRLDVRQHPRPVPAMQLEDMAGRSVALRPQQGEVVLVEFIYTVCGDICQIAGTNFGQLRDRLQAENIPVRMISVSFDPQRDTPQQMASYGDQHGADGQMWTVARPSGADLPALLDRFDVIVIPDEWGGFQHNAAIHVIDPSGRFAAAFDIDAVEEVTAYLQEARL